MSYVSSIGAYSAAAAIAPVRPNPDYAVAREAAKVAPPEQPAGFGPAARVTLSPEAQAYLQSQKTGQAQDADQTKADQTKADQAKAEEARKAQEAEAQAKAEKAAAARKADDAQRAEAEKTSSQQG